MADSKDTSTVFRTLAMAVVLVLVAAAALLFLLPQRMGNGAAELAALSQAIPERATRALAGEPGGFDGLNNSLQRLAELRRSAGEIPGAADDWRELESRAAAIIARRGDIETLIEARATIAGNVDALLELSGEMLNRSSATAIIQEFQLRAARIGADAETLVASDDPVAQSSRMVADTAYLRDVANALAGEESSLDVAPLTGDSRDFIVMPLTTLLDDLDTSLAGVAASASQIRQLNEVRNALSAASNRLMENGFAGSARAGALSDGLANRWLPIGLIVIGALLVLLLLRLNAKSSVFEKAAKVQAEQTERNQQAILRLLDEMGSLADGDLTVEATVTEDITGTIADSFNYAIEELRQLVMTVNETAIMVDSAAKQTESTAAHMARAAENQTREINAATQSIVSMASSIEEVSGNAERSSDVARHSVDVAHKGGEAVRRTIEGMNTIRETIQDTSKRIKRLGESSQEIGNIVELINDIAEQTNILALNASIQASMAGEAGRGFAVVADEVQRLAERSTNATRQIEVLVSTIQADTKEAVVSMERSTTDVVGGALLAENAGAALDEIEQVSNQIASLVQNISSSAQQQASSAADVTRRTRRLSEISEQTGKATTATAAAISKLSEFASQLRKSVAGFTLPAKDMPQPSLQSTAKKVSADKQQRQVSAG
ncbi:MAG TPA: methyl-accepting chemotaxis protein [Woeseiaceae bacterium]|nr:methyl-accepting chemotaxis protein [Woeseiaceae bacterium]